MRAAPLALLAAAACGGGDGPLPTDPCVAAGTCPPGVWVNVTPPDMDPSILAPSEAAYGPGSVVVDPARPAELYVGGGDDGVWRSTDYGNTWTQTNAELPGVARGHTITVAGTTPATVYVAACCGGGVYKSLDAGATFERIATDGTVNDLYSIEIDPYDAEHLISGLHETDGVIESTDGGATWRLVGGDGWPAGGVSWYPYFIDTGDAAGTARTWFAIAQGGGSAVITRDAGATWTIPEELDGLKHPHGSSQMFQDGDTLLVAGVEGPGQGIYRSTDRGDSWTKVGADLPQALAWGTPDNLYAMYSWACSNCDLATNFEIAPRPGDTWSAGAMPDELTIGASRVAVTFNGDQHVFVGVFWASGIWRYVEP